jgi:hypothetical protein
MLSPRPRVTDRYHNNYLDSQSETNKYNTFDVRLDWNASSKDMAFARFSYDNSINAKTSEFTNLPAGGGTGTNPDPRARLGLWLHTRLHAHRGQ